MLAPSPNPRRWFRISLRALMALVLVVGGLAGWMAQAIRTQRAAVAAVERDGGYFRYDWRSDPGPGGPGTAEEPGAPRWLRRWLGDELFQAITMVCVRDLKSAATIEAVARQDRLECLILIDEAGDDVRYDDLRRLRRLRYLEIRGDGLGAAKLAVISRIDSLQTLDIESSRITDAAIAPLARLPDLSYLRCFQTPNLTDAGVARVLAGVPRLRRLSVRFTEPPAATSRQLARSHGELETLDLGYSPVTDADLAAIGRLTRLRELKASSERITDAGLAHLRRLVGLRKLDLSHAPITDAGLAHLAGLTALEELDLSRTKITDAGLVSLDRLSALTHLDLAYNPGITDKGMSPAHFGAKLELLGLYDTGITPDGVQFLQAARPDLSIVARPGNLPAPSSEPPR